MSNVLMKSSSGTSSVGLETFMLSKRRIIVRGEINEDVALDLAEKIMYLEEDSDEEIQLWLSSVGGEIQTGLAILDVIKAFDNIAIVGIGHIYSMAAVILSAGKKGKRYLLPHTEVMIHEPLLRSRVDGTTSSVKQIAESLQSTKRLVNTLLAEQTGHTLEEIDNETMYDHYFTAEEAIKFGLADKVVNFNELRR